jgi:tetratricopeptide (TPR) repeat protein
MSSLAEHLKAIEKASHNLDAVDAARRRLVEELDADKEANAAVAEALYRLGVTTLLRAKDQNAASEFFKRAADKKDPAWSPMARTSYALTLHAKKKHQQAVFELKKVIGQPGKEASPVAATALCMLTLVLRDSGAKPSEIEKADKDRIAALDALVKATPPKTPEEAHWRLLLAMAHKEGGSRTECKRHLEAIVALGNVGGDDNLAVAKEMLKRM